MATETATNPAKSDLDFEYDFVSVILQFHTKTTQNYTIFAINRYVKSYFDNYFSSYSTV